MNNKKKNWHHFTPEQLKIYESVNLWENTFKTLCNLLYSVQCYYRLHIVITQYTLTTSIF